MMAYWDKPDGTGGVFFASHPDGIEDLLYALGYEPRTSGPTVDEVIAELRRERSEAAAGHRPDEPVRCAEPPAAPLLPSRTVYVVTRAKPLRCGHGHYEHTMRGVFTERSNAERFIADATDAMPSYLPRPVFTIHEWRLDEVPAPRTAEGA